jgi:putative transposase
MARRFNFALGEVYHLYNRGVDKRIVFVSKMEWDRFVALLYICNQEKMIAMEDYPRTFAEIPPIQKDPLVDILAYCLMPNHFHIMVRERAEGGISKYMQKVTTAYTMYFNARHDRTGSLFGGTFKATHVDDDVYLKYLVAYIHLNPIKLIEPSWKDDGIHDMTGAQKFLQNYQYSSYLDYIGTKRPENVILNSKLMKEYFDQTYNFKTATTEWLNGGPVRRKV